MRQKLKKFLTATSLLTLLVVPAIVAFAPTAQAALIDTGSAGEACKALSPDNPNAACDQTAETSIKGIIQTALEILSVVIGIIAVIMLMIGGIKYITSSGDPGNIASAKNSILFAVVGLIVVALAQIIVRFVLQRVG